MSMIKCPGCGMQMGEGAFDNCPTCNEPLSVTVETNPATEPAATETPVDADAEAETETE